MNEKRATAPDLEEMRLNVPTKLKTDSALALIALVDPVTLDGSVAAVLAGSKADGEASGEATAEAPFDIRSANHTLESGKGAIVQADMAAAFYRDGTLPTSDQLEQAFRAPDTSQRPRDAQEIASFAQEIVNKQRTLTLPARALGTIACGVAMSSVSGVSAYELLQGIPQRGEFTAVIASTLGNVGATLASATLESKKFITSTARRAAWRQLRKRDT